MLRASVPSLLFGPKGTMSNKALPKDLPISTPNILSQQSTPPKDRIINKISALQLIITQISLHFGLIFISIQDSTSWRFFSSKSWSLADCSSNSLLNCSKSSRQRSMAAERRTAPGRPHRQIGWAKLRKPGISSCIMTHCYQFDPFSSIYSMIFTMLLEYLWINQTQTFLDAGNCMGDIQHPPPSHAQDRGRAGVVLMKGASTGGGRLEQVAINCQCFLPRIWPFCSLPYFNLVNLVSLVKWTFHVWNKLQWINMNKPHGCLRKPLATHRWAPCADLGRTVGSHKGVSRGSGRGFVRRGLAQLTQTQL